MLINCFCISGAAWNWWENILHFRVRCEGSKLYSPRAQHDIYWQWYETGKCILFKASSILLHSISQQAWHLLHHFSASLNHSLDIDSFVGRHLSVKFCFWFAGKFFTLTTGANERRWGKMKDKLHTVVDSFKIFKVWDGVSQIWLGTAHIWLQLANTIMLINIFLLCFLFSSFLSFHFVLLRGWERGEIFFFWINILYSHWHMKYIFAEPAFTSAAHHNHSVFHSTVSFQAAVNWK